MLKQLTTNIRVKDGLRECIREGQHVVVVVPGNVKLNNIKMLNNLYGYNIGVLSTNRQHVYSDVSVLERLGHAGLIVLVEGSETQHELNRLLMRANVPLVHVKTNNTSEDTFGASNVINLDYATKLSTQQFVTELVSIYDGRIGNTLTISKEKLVSTMQSGRKVGDVTPPPKGRRSRIRKCQPDKNRPRKA